jgi:hypothetical protein
MDAIGNWKLPAAMDHDKDYSDDATRENTTSNTSGELRAQTQSTRCHLWGVSNINQASNGRYGQPVIVFRRSCTPQWGVTSFDQGIGPKTLGVSPINILTIKVGATPRLPPYYDSNDENSPLLLTLDEKQHLT